MPFSSEPMHAAENSVPSDNDAGLKASGEGAMQLLVPINAAGNVIHGARYAKHLVAQGLRVKIILLHVTKPRREETSFGSFSSNIDLIEEQQAEALLKEAALFLNESHLSHRTYIISGDVVFSILDAAELLNCDQIILSAMKRRSWLRPFSSDIVGKIAHAARSVSVVTVDSNGLATNIEQSYAVHQKQNSAHAIKSV
jgi:K+-sensing histidine kinase KdpD